MIRKNASVYGRPRPLTMVASKSSAPKKRRASYKAPMYRSPTLPVGFPLQMNMRHKYVETLQLSEGGAFVHHLFTANGMFDPNISGLGHQPMYFDTMSPLYHHYHVLTSKIKWTIVPFGTAVQNPYKIITWVNGDSAVTGSGESFSEQTSAKTRYAQGGINPDRMVLYDSFSTYKTFGPAPMANNELRGNNATNPNEQAFYQVTFRSLDGVSPINIYVIAEIEYTAVWSELKELNSS